MSVGVFADCGGDRATRALALVNEQREQAVLTGLARQRVPVGAVPESARESGRIVRRKREDTFESRRRSGRLQGHGGLG